MRRIGSQASLCARSSSRPGSAISMTRNIRCSKKQNPKTFTITRLENLEKSGFLQKISQAGQTKQSFLYVAITGNETHYRFRLVKGLAVYTTRPPTMVSTDSMERIWSSPTVK